MQGITYNELMVVHFGAGEQREREAREEEEQPGRRRRRRHGERRCASAFAQRSLEPEIEPLGRWLSVEGFRAGNERVRHRARTVYIALVAACRPAGSMRVSSRSFSRFHFGGWSIRFQTFENPSMGEMLPAAIHASSRRNLQAPEAPSRSRAAARRA